MKVREIVDDARVQLRVNNIPEPDITLITPTFSRHSEGLLLPCLSSAGAQSFTNFEHIVIDDGSSDGTREAILELSKRDSRVIYVRHDKNCGLPSVRTNEGILKARGRAIAFLFDDNVLKPDFLESAWRLLNESGADVVHGAVEVPRADGTTETFGASPVTLDLIRNFNTIANGGVLIRRDFFDRFGLYDPHLIARRVCDWELWIRSLWLGATFCPLPQIVATERGHLSKQSLGNTVAFDWKVLLSYVQDNRAYADRARRFHPDAILDEDVLRPERVKSYVRDSNEWTDLVSSTYTPFLKLNSAGFDPLLLSNRAESLNPKEGWNPSWALGSARFRLLLLTNALPSLASVLIDAYRNIPGAIVLSAPGWHLGMFEPGSLDIIVCFDISDPKIEPYLERHWAAGTRLICISKQRADAALRWQALSDLILDVSGDMVPFGVRLPSLPLAPLHFEGQHKKRLAYRLFDNNPRNEEQYAGTISRTDSTSSGVSLASFVISNPHAEIVVEQSDIDALPAGELIGIRCLAATNCVSIVTSKDPGLVSINSDRRAEIAGDWASWFANTIRVTRLRSLLGLSPETQLTIDVYLNSELFAGSEVYGLQLAKLLSEFGIRSRIRIPERNIYGDPKAINEWLANNGLEPAQRAPYLPSVHHNIFRPYEERAGAVKELAKFVRSDVPHLIIAAGHIPQLTEIPDCPPLYMAFFSSAAYQQSWLLDLRGKLQGIMSDSGWALQSMASVIGAPNRVIPSAVSGLGGSQIERVLNESKTGPIKIVIAGTIVPRKGQLEAAKATVELRRRGYDVELHLYGFEIDIAKSYAALVDEFIGTEGKGFIFRHGFVDDSSIITRSNHIVLCASTDESLPQGLIFQMYQGLIGVSVLSGGVDEIIADGVTGFIAEDPGSSGIADAIERALCSSENWEQIAENARLRIRNRCGSSHVTTALLDLLAEGLELTQPGFSHTSETSRVANLALPSTDQRSELSNFLDLQVDTLLCGRSGGDRPRIAYFCHSPFLGGAENVILKVIKLAIAYRCDPILVLPSLYASKHEHLNRCAEELGISVYYLPVSVQTEINPAFFVEAERVDKIKKWLRDQRISLVHSVTYLPEVGRATRDENIPHVASLFATESVEFASVDHCDIVHSDTLFYAERWSRILNTPSRRIISYVPEEYFRVVEERNISDRVDAINNRPSIGIFGTLQPRKGQKNAIEAIGLLRQRHGIEVELRLHGYMDFFPEYLSDCRTAARAYGVDELVHFAGFVEESTHRAMRDVDIVLCASDWESLPQSILEGMASGALVIAPRVGGVSEILNEECGIIIPDNSPDWIARGILRAISESKAAIRTRIERARVIAGSCCSQDVAAAAFLDVYRHAIRSRNNEGDTSGSMRIRGNAWLPNSVLGEKPGAVQSPMTYHSVSAKALSPISSSNTLLATVATTADAGHSGGTVFEARVAGFCGVDVLAPRGSIVEGTLVSASRPMIEIRRSHAEVDHEFGIAQLRWPALEGSGRHRFKMFVKATRMDNSVHSIPRRASRLRITSIHHQTI